MSVDFLRTRLTEAIQNDGRSTSALAEEVGVTEGTLRQFLKGQTASIKFDVVQKLAVALGVTLDWLSGTETDKATTEASGLVSQSHVPIIGFAAASFASGKLLLENNTIGSVRKPHALVTARDIYAIYIMGDSMFPEHKSGDVRLVSPHMPCRVNDTALVKEQDADGKTYVSIGTMRRNEEDSVVLEKIHPETKEIKIKRKNIIAVDRVLTMNELLGV